MAKPERQNSEARIAKGGFCSTMAQITMAHATKASLLWRRSSLAHSSIPQFRCGADPVWLIRVRLSYGMAHRSVAHSPQELARFSRCEV